MINSFFSTLLTISQKYKFEQIAKKLQIDVNWLIAVVFFETSKTFSTKIKNNIGSVGLIQFTADPSTPNYKLIAGKKYSLNYIQSLDFNQQMDLVYLYYKPYIGKMSNFLDVYLVTFFPLALGKTGSFVLKTTSLSASLIAKQNPIFDRNKDGIITRSEIETFFSKWFTPSIYSTIQKSKLIPLLILTLFFFF